MKIFISPKGAPLRGRFSADVASRLKSPHCRLRSLVHQGDSVKLELTRPGGSAQNALLDDGSPQRSRQSIGCEHPARQATDASRPIRSHVQSPGTRRRPAPSLGEGRRALRFGQQEAGPRACGPLVCAGLAALTKNIPKHAAVGMSGSLTGRLGACRFTAGCAPRWRRRGLPTAPAAGHVPCPGPAAAWRRGRARRCACRRWGR